MKDQTTKRSLRCAIYTRVSTDQGLEQDFNSLDAQREACEAYIKSQAHEGWRPVRDRYDDGGYSGGSMERPALQKLLIDVQARRIDVIVVYKVDRLTRSLADFAKLVETFDAHGVSFLSVTQSFNTTTSMGRLTLNVLLSFAQFEREVTGERIRDKISASKKKSYRRRLRTPHAGEEPAFRRLRRRWSPAAGDAGDVRQRCDRGSRRGDCRPRLAVSLYRRCASDAGLHLVGPDGGAARYGRARRRDPRRPLFRGVADGRLRNAARDLGAARPDPCVAGDRHPFPRDAAGRRAARSMSAIFTPFVFQSAVQAITPILLASLAGVLCGRVGVFNLALEGQMLVGAFAAIVGSYFTPSALGGVAAAMAGAVAFSLVLAYGATVFRGDPVVISASG